MKKVVLYSDGACEGNPGPGGWAAILTYGQQMREISGGVPATTNNRMELIAAVEGLRALKEPCEIEFFTDSQYVQIGISEWLKDWKSRGWKTKEKKAVKNEELWKQLDAEAAKHKISWKWLKGHAGHEINERCDLLARTEILKIKQQFNPDQLKTFLEEFKQNLEPTDLNGKLEGII
jgi:ribonuclease HI